MSVIAFCVAAQATVRTTHHKRPHFDHDIFCTPVLLAFVLLCMPVIVKLQAEDGVYSFFISSLSLFFTACVKSPTSGIAAVHST